LNYVKGFFQLPVLAPMVTRETRDGVELSNGVDISVVTNDFRAVRGRPILCAVLDEVAFYRDETSATPDLELYRALEPGLLTLPSAMLIGISSPYRRSGLLFEKWRRHYGKDGDDVLVIRAPSRTMNPTLSQAAIDRALAEDRAAASSEYLADWRSDIEGVFTLEALGAAVIPDRHELARLKPPGRASRPVQTPFEPKATRFTDRRAGSTLSDSTLERGLSTMTIHADLTAITPTANARSAFKKAGTDLDELLAQVANHATDLQRLLKQVIALHPSSGGDSTNYTALSNLLAELT
jgi:hypothetical protein